MKKRRLFTLKELETLPMGFQFFEQVEKKSRPFEYEDFIHPYVSMEFYFSDKCMVIKFYKSISKIVHVNSENNEETKSF